MATQSYALGLGNLQINSALDETLKAEISLMLGDGETVEDLSVTLASSEEYRKVGLDKSFVPANIQLEVFEDENNKHIKLTSIGSVNEPIVSLLLVVDWKNGHLLREYTLLLDPQVFGISQDQGVSSNTVQTQTYDPKPVVEDDSTDESTNNTSTYSQPDQSQPTTIDNSSFTNEAEVVVVESGDTLWRIASRYSGTSTNPQQMMVAIFDENPTAFSNNDMNRLKKGAKLTIPTSDVASAISFQQAFSEVKAQVEQYKQETSDYSTSGSDSSSEVDYGIEIVPPRDNTSTSDSSSTSGASNTESLAELSRTKEELVSVNLENQELSDRVSDLEVIVKDQEVAMQIKDDNLAQLQQQVGELSLDNTISDPETNEVDVTTVDDSTDDDLSDVATQSLDEDQAIAILEGMEDDSQTETDDVWGEDEDSSLAESSDELLTDTDGSQPTNDADELETITLVDENETSAEDDNTATPIQTPAQPMSFMDKAMQYKTEGVIGLGALLAIFGFLFFRNRKTETVDDNGSFLDSISKEDSISEEDITDQEIEEMAVEEDEDLSDIIEDVDEAIESLDDDLDDVPAVTVMNEIDDEFDELDELVNDSEEVIDLVTDEAEDGFDLESDSLEDFDLEEELSTEDSDEFLELTEDDTESLDLDFESHEDSLSDDEEANKESEDEGFELDEDVSVDDFDAELDSLIESSSDEDSEEDSTLTELDLGDEEFDNLMNEVDQDLNLDEISLDLDDDQDAPDENEKNSAEEFLEQDISLDLELENENTELDEVAEDSSDLEDLVFDTGEVKIIEEDNIDDRQDDDAEIEIEHEDDIDIGLDLDDFVTDDAVDTKLDLAKAYFEMGRFRWCHANGY